VTHPTAIETSADDARPIPAPRGRLTRYARWQLRDYALDKAVPTATLILLTVYLTLIPAIVTYGRPHDGAAPRGFVEAFSLTILIAVLEGALLATTGIVADDRKLGYFRFYFAKPVSVWRFYATKFAVYLAGFLLVLAILLLLHTLLVGRYLPPLLLPVAAAMFVAVGGIGFLASAIWKYDWVTLSTVVFSSTIMWEVWEHATGWRAVVVRLLPPINRMGGVVGAACAGTVLPAADFWWLTGYGVVCFVLGLLVLRRRALVSA
jgi:hypothetical protein